MYRIAFSIAAHERYESIIDLVENINRFNANCAIIIHLALNFYNNSLISEEVFFGAIKKYNNVYINVNRHKTSLYSQLFSHYLNFQYAKSVIDFAFFSMTSSNDMYLKNGLYEYVGDADCILEFKKMKKSQWAHYDKFIKDDYIQSILSKNGVTDFYLSYMEGTVYKKNLIDRIYSNFTLDDLQNYKYTYPVDEALIASLCLKLTDCYKEGRAVRNGIGRLYVNYGVINKVIKSDDKFAVKRVDRNFYNYQRVFIRDQITKNDNIYMELGLPKVKIGKARYFVLDLACTIKTRIEKALSFIRFKFRALRK